jgi:hypothetical protein
VSKNALRYRSEADMPPSMQMLLKQAGEHQRNQELSRLVHQLPVKASGGTGEKRANKYGAQVTVVDGIRFDSKREARYYERLVRERAAGLVSYFLRQVPIHLPGGTKLVIDFLVVMADGAIRHIDVKGRETTAFKIKRREVQHHYPIVIELA